MDETEVDPPETPQDIYEALVEGQNPCDVGGEDALANRPPPSESHQPAVFRRVLANVEKLCSKKLKRAETGFVDLASKVRGNPSAIQSGRQQIDAIPQALDIELNSHIEHNSAEFLRLGADKESGNTLYAWTCQRARAQRPPSGTFTQAIPFLLWVAIVFGIETSLAIAWLWHALGFSKAAMSGLMMSFISLCGGYVCTFLLLRPTEHERVNGWRRFGHWGAAGAIFCLTLALMYIGAVYRAIAIAGVDANWTEFAAKLKSPGEVLFNSDVAVLALIGLGGFGLIVIEVWKHFAGFRPRLRQVGLAYEKADEEHLAMAQELWLFVKRGAVAANGRLDVIENENIAWARATADYADEADGIALDVKRYPSTVWSQALRIFAEYFDGYVAVRPSQSMGQIPLGNIAAEIETPAMFANARRAAIQDARSVSEAVLATRVKIAEVEKRAIQKINRMGGFVSEQPEGNEPLPTGRNPS